MISAQTAQDGPLEDERLIAVRNAKSAAHRAITHNPTAPGTRHLLIWYVTTIVSELRAEPMNRLTDPDTVLWHPAGTIATLAWAHPELFDAQKEPVLHAIADVCEDIDDGTPTEEDWNKLFELASKLEQ
ncbi:hypothetical protein JNJ66_00875 [Candidatus Saccharibacteria bacterium]|nr:hypothetical protein [Candidatus Saccharibacteria bacterium]